MSVTNLVSFKEVRAREAKRRLSRWKRARPRYLGGKDVPFARDHYPCCRCIFPILPGDEYRRERYVRSYPTNDGEGSHFYYLRYHLPQCYGPSEEEDREMRDQIEREREAERAAEQHAA